MLERIKAKIESEIERLVHELNVELPKAIQKAVELGDLRENADYKAALERREFVQARVTHLTQRMSELSKIDVETIATDRAGFGSKLKLRNVETGDEVEYTIVTGDFMDIDAGHISMESPIGRAMLGAKQGEEVDVQLPGREVTFKVVELTTLPEMVG